MKEIWKDITGYEGCYQVSNMGRVRNLPRYDSNNRFRKGRILSNHRRPNGYLAVHLSKNGISKWYSVHRLVALAFIEQKEGLDIVNHIDNNPQNNNATNLEWTDYKGNMQHASRQGRMRYNPDNLKKAVESIKRPVIATDKRGVDHYFNSQVDAVRGLGLNPESRKHIASACKKLRGYKTVAGYTWRYANG